MKMFPSQESIKLGKWFNKSVFRLFLMTQAALLFGACNKDAVDAPVARETMLPVLPAHFPDPVYQFENNPLSRAGFELGRSLFYDPILSVDSSISCASCHKQSDAFSDVGKAFSEGIGARRGKRNSPGLMNLAWNPTFMWDGGITHIEVMPFAPIIHPDEMGMDMMDLIDKLNKNVNYKQRFFSVFGEEPITDQQLLFAITQFQGNLVSANAKYDQQVIGPGIFSDEELEGWHLFRLNCGNCHLEPLFTDYSFQNNGLDSVFNDEGRFLITQNEDDIGKFKVPTLRNIELTAPYMHDGRFNTLEEVLNHYNQGIIARPNMIPPLVDSNGKAAKFNLTNQEIGSIIAFLKTLTDGDYISDKNYQSPLE